MNALQSLGSALGLAALAAPAFAVLALALRGTGGLLLHPVEGFTVAALVTVAGALRALTGAFTLDDPFLAPLLVAAPVAVGLRFGPRVAVASTASAWWLFAVLAFANETEAALDESGGPRVALLVIAATVAVLSGLYAPVAAAHRKALGYVPALLLVVPAFVGSAGVWADPTTWVGWVATAAWIVVLERRLARVEVREGRLRAR